MNATFPRNYALPFGVMLLGGAALIALLAMTTPVGWVLLPIGALLVVTGGVGALILHRLETDKVTVGMLMYALGVLALLSGICGAAVSQILSRTL